MTSTDRRQEAEQLVDALELTVAPIAITFTAQVPSEPRASGLPEPSSRDD